MWATSRHANTPMVELTPPTQCVWIMNLCRINVYVFTFDRTIWKLWNSGTNGYPKRQEESIFVARSEGISLFRSGSVLSVCRCGSRFPLFTRVKLVRKTRCNYSKIINFISPSWLRQKTHTIRYNLMRLLRIAFVSLSSALHVPAGAFVRLSLS